MDHLSKFLLFALSIVISSSLLAQDKIYKTDGGIIEAKVKRVDPTAIVYKRFDNQDGPEYGILKKEVVKIVYQNGTTDVFDGVARNGEEPRGRSYKNKETNGDKRVKKKYGDNIFSVTPGAYTVSVDGSINDVGVGLCYERLLDNRGHISVILPVMVCFASTRDFNNYYYNSYSNNGVTYTDHYHSFYIMPGVRFYPAGQNTAVRYSIGASLFSDFGTEPLGVFDVNTGSPASTYHYSMLGLMLSNSINIMAARHLYMALDMSAGIPVSDNRHSNYDQTLDGLLGPFMQFGFKFGYRY